MNARKILFGLVLGFVLALPFGAQAVLQGLDLTTNNTKVSTSTAHGILVGQGANAALVSIGPCSSNVPVTGTGGSGDPQCGGTIPVANGGTGDTGTAWSSYSPTISSGSGTLTSASATGRFKQIGKTVFVQITGTITTNGTGATRVDLSLPAAASGSITYFVGGVENAITGKQLNGIIHGSGASTVNVRFYDATYPGADGAVLNLTGVYEAN